IVEAVSGVCLPVAQARVLLGQGMKLEPSPPRGVCYRFFTPPAGVFGGVWGLDEARRLPGVIEVGFALRSGAVVGPLTKGAEGPGCVVAEGETRGIAVANARRAIAAVHFSTRATRAAA